MNRDIERWQLLPPGFALLSGVGFGVIFFGYGSWGAFGILIPALWLIGLLIVVTVVGTSIARGDPNLVRAGAVFVGLLVAHCALALGILYATWIAFELVFGVPGGA